MEKTGITQDGWLNYHCSHFSVIAVSAYDAALMLTNAVFDLGIDPKSCKDHTVCENRHVKSTHVHSALKSLRKITERLTRIRHGYVHRGEEVDLGPELRLLETHRFLEEALTQTGKSIPRGLFNREDLSRLYRLRRSKLAQALRTYTSNLAQGIEVLFGALLPHYPARDKALRCS